MDYAARLERLRHRLQGERTDALVVTHLPNLRYLVGFTGSNGLLTLTADGLTFFSDSRYREQAAQEVTGARVVIPARGDLISAAAKRLARCRRVALEAEHLSWGDWLRWRAAVGSRPRLVPAYGWVEQLRAIKAPAEIAAIRGAIALAAGVLPAVLRTVRPGLSEQGLAARLEFAMRRAGGDGAAFETIVASGARGALVHGRASAKPLRSGEVVILDYGVWRGGYCSDMTRTFALGRASAKARRIFRAVRQAQEAALAACRPDIPASRVDAAARDVLAGHGLAEYFVHSTGHGLGLEVHERPRLARRSNERLAVGNVITIEPGVYLPGWGGVRIEDVVAITPRGAEVLTPASSDLMEVAG
ncbi:MAG TPA: Xaa-Pro peptidase family protein [Terriglobales bacterium]|nr:Xaa-Pro peptidase family protein [Terriglobales bacterium]